MVVGGGVLELWETMSARGMKEEAIMHGGIYLVEIISDTKLAI